MQMRIAHNILAGLVLLLGGCTSVAATLENEHIKATLSPRGALQTIADLDSGKTITLESDAFELTVDEVTFKPLAGTSTPACDTSTPSKAIYTYKQGDYQLQVVYELQPGWRFVSKQLLVTKAKGKTIRVGKVTPFIGKVGGPVAEAYRLTGGKYGLSMRLGKPAATHGLILLVQTHYGKYTAENASATASYTADMNWAMKDGPFPGERMCFVPYEMTGQTFRSDMLAEWRYVQDPEKFVKEGNRIDWAEISAVTECARAFLLQKRDKSVRVHIPWCENDYQIDHSTPEGQAEYRRIMDQCAAVGVQYVLFTPSNLKLGPLKECRDAWKWEGCLMLNLGQKIRKGEWVPGKDAIPASTQSALDYAKTKNLKLLAYAYPSLPWTQDPTWMEWQTKHGKQPRGYLTVDTGLRSFQDWYTDMLLEFCKATGCAGYSFDHWWIAYTGKIKSPELTSLYQQWFGTRRVTELLREKMPDIIVDTRQQLHWFGTWTWLAGTYPHPMMSDEQPGSFNAIGDLSTDRVNGARQRYIAWRLMMRDFCPIEILPGFITHQTMRSDAKRVMRRDRYRVRDWDLLGWKYNLLSSVATAPFNHVVNYVPARDFAEFEYFSKADQAFFRDWLDFTDANMPVLRKVRPITEQPMVGRCDGYAAVDGDHGFVFMFNPNYRQMNADVTLDTTIGLDAKACAGKSFVLEELYPVKGRRIGKPGTGFWQYGDTVSLAMCGTTTRVVKITPVTKLDAPQLLGLPGTARLSGTTLALTDVSGLCGTTQPFTVVLRDTQKITVLTINGQPAKTPFTQKGNVVTSEASFAGTPFGKAQALTKYDPKFAGKTVDATFTIPQRILDQLAARKKAWPVEYTDDDKVAPWTAPDRLLLFVQIASPHTKLPSKKLRRRRHTPMKADSVTVSINGEPRPVLAGFNGVYEYVPRSMLGMYVDVSDLKANTKYTVKVTLPDDLKPGQFQGLFFEHVENEYTQELK